VNLLGNYKSVATYKTEGIILKKQKIQEADYIITIFSKHYGKIRAVAKGARRIISRKSGSLELLNWCSFFLAEGRNLDLISEVELKKTFQSLKEDLHKSIYSFQVLEIVDRLTVSENNPRIFKLLTEVLTLMDFWKKDNWEKINLLIGSFNIKLLHVLGFWDEREITKLYKLSVDDERRLKILRVLPLSNIQKIATEDVISSRIKDIIDKYTADVLESQIRSIKLIKDVDEMRNYDD